MKSVIKFIIFIIFSVCMIFSASDTKYSKKTINEIKQQVKMQEKDYVNKYCNGIKEYVLPDKTRIDCLTDEYAIEFDYAKKWAESIGQSLYYAKMTNKKPAVAIIISKEDDYKYIQRIRDADKDITIFEISAVEK